ncbi:MBL fold metallo-hydrolase [Bacteroidia bacterium]|nr:MBL fold metallo-hydrolase [Bacteroidia bacterium]
MLQANGWDLKVSSMRTDILCFLVFTICISLSCCNHSVKHSDQNAEENAVSLFVLGTVQDAGSPHIGCKKKCCKALFIHPDNTRKVTSLGLINHRSNETWLMEATPDIAAQLKDLKRLSNNTEELPNGILLTHAHIGHYSGLMYLGKEAINADSVSVFAMPTMKEFLETNGPWSQLVSNKNINLVSMQSQIEFSLGDRSDSLRVKPIIVPHRDEYSETIGFVINGPNKTALFVPDIDKWDKWDTDIKGLIQEVDYAFVDATFYSGQEINYRDISQIPHPMVKETMHRLSDLSINHKKKVYFIHMNHTNPLLKKESGEYQEVIDAGYNIASYLQEFDL